MKTSIKVKICLFVAWIKAAFNAFEASVLQSKNTYQTRYGNSRFAQNRMGKMGLGVVGSVVGIAVGAYVVASMIPDAVILVTNETNWEGAPDSVKTLGTIVLGIIIVVACIFLFLRLASGEGD